MFALGKAQGEQSSTAAQVLGKAQGEQKDTAARADAVGGSRLSPTPTQSAVLLSAPRDLDPNRVTSWMTG